MKILLVQPGIPPVTIGGEDFFIYEPLALEYLAAPLIADHEVRILDLRFADEDLLRTLREFTPEIVGITANTVHVNVVRKLCDEIKTWNPRVLTVVGGHHATVVPEDFRSPSIDLVVSGEGVRPFEEIVRRSNAGAGFEGIAGVCFARDGEWNRTAPEPFTDLDSVPFPVRELTARYRSRYFSEWMKPLASIRTSKGCPFRCNFCALWKLTGGRYLRRDPDRIVQELAEIEEEYVFFADDESLIDARRMKALAERIRAAGIRKRYFLYGRSDTVARNRDLLELWKEIGLERVFVGFEFFRDRDLEFVHKESTAAHNEQAIAVLHDLGLEVYASFIVRPDFTREDFSTFIDYCRGLDLNFAGFAVLTPLPGTDLYEQVKDELLTHDYDYYDFVHTVLPTALPLEEFYREVHRLHRGAVSFRRGMSLLRKFPLREWPEVTRKTLKWYRTLRNAHRDYEGRRPHRSGSLRSSESVR